MTAVQLQSNPTNGSFILSNTAPVYPATDSKVVIIRTGFNSVHVKATLVNAHLIIRQYGTIATSNIIHPMIGTNKINDTVPFPFSDNSGYLSFEIEAMDKSNPECSAEIKFALENISSKLYSDLSAKYKFKSI
jgi:hypothetical protein